MKKIVFILALMMPFGLFAKSGGTGGGLNSDTLTKVKVNQEVSSSKEANQGNSSNCNCSDCKCESEKK